MVVKLEFSDTIWCTQFLPSTYMKYSADSLEKSYVNVIILQKEITQSEARDNEELSAACQLANQACQPLARRAAAIQSGVHLPQEKTPAISPLHPVNDNEGNERLVEEQARILRAKTRVCPPHIVVVQVLGSCE